jgi:uncharacterized metal-binding protein
MPAGRTHDLITILLAPFMAAAVFYFTSDWALTAIASGAMIFGGLMFGPDLDIQSRQYARWGPLRFLWWPYKALLPHRSRLSHSILLGTLIRVVYFLAVLSIIVAAALYVRDVYIYKTSAGVTPLKDAFSQLWEVFAPIKRSYLIAAFAGLWMGATSHTVSDVLGTFIKSVKKSI